MSDRRTPAGPRRKPVPYTPEEIVARFEAGEARLDLTKRYRVRVAEIDAALATAGYEPPRRTSLRGQPRPVIDIDLNDLRTRYEAGESENALAKHYGCSRTSLRRRLVSTGVDPRGRGAAMAQRHAELSPEERQALADAAHVAVRGRTATEEERARRAETVGGQVNLWTSPHEVMLDAMLRARGHIGIPQLPVGRYNIDLAFEPLAVELHRYTGHPLNYHLQPPRVAYLAERGWSTLYVWLRLDQTLTEAVADRTAEQIEEYRRDPAAFGKVRVVKTLRTGVFVLQDCEPSAAW